MYTGSNLIAVLTRRSRNLKVRPGELVVWSDRGIKTTGPISLLVNSFFDDNINSVGQCFSIDSGSWVLGPLLKY